MIDHSETLPQIQNFAKSEGLEDQLQSRLDRLNSLAQNYRGELHLYSDFAPHSLGFTIFRGDQHILTGGLIYHPATNDQSYSTQLTPYVGWSIHT